MCLNFVEKLPSKTCIKDEGKWFKFHVLEIYIYIWLVYEIAMHQIMAVYFTCMKVINICTSKQ